jgi:hypothetical protein
MRTFLFFFSFMFYLSLSGQDSYRVSEIRAGNFEIVNGKVIFEKVYESPMSMDILEKNLKKLNDLNSGMQVKSLRKDGMNGVMIRYQLDWTAAGFKKRKIATFLRFPVNANFVVTRDGNNYQVRVADIWFTNTVNPGSQQHLSLESIVVMRQGLRFTRDKELLRSLSILDENFELMFQGKPNTF